jgi:hypothetical protein
MGMPRTPGAWPPSGSTFQHAVEWRRDVHACLPVAPQCRSLCFNVGGLRRPHPGLQRVRLVLALASIVCLASIWRPQWRVWCLDRRGVATCHKLGRFVLPVTTFAFQLLPLPCAQCMTTAPSHPTRRTPLSATLCPAACTAQIRVPGPPHVLNGCNLPRPREWRLCGACWRRVRVARTRSHRGA